MRILAILLALVLVACNNAPQSSPNASSRSSTPDASAPLTLPSQPPDRTSDSMSYMLAAFREVGYDLRTPRMPSSEEAATMVYTSDDGDIDILLQSIVGDSSVLWLASITLNGNAERDEELSAVRDAFIKGVSSITNDAEAVNFLTTIPERANGPETMQTSSAEADYELSIRRTADGIQLTMMNVNDSQPADS